MPRPILTPNEQERLNAEVNEYAADLTARLTAEPHRRAELLEEGREASLNFRLRREAMLEEPLDPQAGPVLWEAVRTWDRSAQVAYFGEHAVANREEVERLDREGAEVGALQDKIGRAEETIRRQSGYIRRLEAALARGRAENDRLKRDQQRRASHAHRDGNR